LIDRKKIVLIDSDILRYQVGSIEHDHPYVDNEKIPAPVNFVYKQVNTYIDRCMEVSEATAAHSKRVLFFTGKGNFRFNIATEQPYKGHRIQEKPDNWYVVDKYIRKNYHKDIIDCFGYEADDAMAFHRFERNTYDYIICSRDKDLTTVPGWHYRWSCGKDQPEVLPHFMSIFESNRFFFYQCLIGDATDNICGCGRKEMTYHGSFKKVMEGITGHRPEYDMRGKKKSITIASRTRHAKKLLARGLRSPFTASVLEARFEAIQEPRRIGVGPTEAEVLLDKATTLRGMAYVVNEEYCKRFPKEDFEAILLENARLLYMGQTPNNLFNWSWFDGLWEVDDTINYYDKTEYELREQHNNAKDQP
jgi:hypothetical protein